MRGARGDVSWRRPPASSGSSASPQPPLSPCPSLHLYHQLSTATGCHMSRTESCSGSQATQGATRRDGDIWGLGLVLCLRTRAHISVPPTPGPAMEGAGRGKRGSAQPLAQSIRGVFLMVQILVSSECPLDWHQHEFEKLAWEKWSFVQPSRPIADDLQ